MLLMNLIISMLANTYGIYDASSDGFLFAQILKSRDELGYDKNYGAMFSQIPPLNFLQIIFSPIMVFMNKKMPQLKPLNEVIMKV